MKSVNKRIFIYIWARVCHYNFDFGFYFEYDKKMYLNKPIEERHNNLM